MSQIDITVATTSHQVSFRLETNRPTVQRQSGFSLRYDGQCPGGLSLTPPTGETFRSVTYRLTTPLCNFDEVIVPDTGRSYSSQLQLVDFWGKTWYSRVNAVRMPVFLFTGQTKRMALAFGVIGPNVETDFSVRKPMLNRSLQAWMKQLELEIACGNDTFPLPEAVTKASPDGTLTQWIYYRDESSLGNETWIDTLRDFGRHMQDRAGQPPRPAGDALLPWWCPWTDWHSDTVNEDVVLANVEAGLALGMKNFILDDGWFGPGLDSPPDATLNLGDWMADPGKFPDLRRLVDRIQDMGGHAVLWCAPHAVSKAAHAYEHCRHLIIEHQPGVPYLTGNGYHPLCLQSPETREYIARMCTDLIQRYGAHGAKYDLFNNLPSEPCISDRHSHDTTSTLEGLSRLMSEMDRRARAINPQFITELKQNYATPWLHASGSCVRAGDTPYNPQGNFMRTAYINAYTPYSLNDYQTLSNHDAPEAAIGIIIKMMAVGIPTYSMDLVTLRSEHKASLGFYHRWYAENLDAFHHFREPLDPQLGTWRVPGEGRDLIFMTNGACVLDTPIDRPTDLVVGSFVDRLFLTSPSVTATEAVIRHPLDSRERKHRIRKASVREIPVRPGDIVSLH